MCLWLRLLISFPVRYSWLARMALVLVLVGVSAGVDAEKPVVAMHTYVQDY